MNSHKDRLLRLRDRTSTLETSMAVLPTLHQQCIDDHEAMRKLDARIADIENTVKQGALGSFGPGALEAKFDKLEAHNASLQQLPQGYAQEFEDKLHKLEEMHINAIHSIFQPYHKSSNSTITPRDSSPAGSRS